MTIKPTWLLPNHSLHELQWPRAHEVSQESELLSGMLGLVFWFLPLMYCPGCRNIKRTPLPPYTSSPSWALRRVHSTWIALGRSSHLTHWQGYQEFSKDENHHKVPNLKKVPSYIWIKLNTSSHLPCYGTPHWITALTESINMSRKILLV